jgi:hypothetical protein
MNFLKFWVSLFGPVSFSFGGGGSGGGGPSTTTGTTYQTNIPEYASPYVMNMLGATQKQLFETDTAGDISGFRPYQPYSQNVNDYVAPFSPLQQQAMLSTGQLQTPGQFAPASNLAMASGIGSYGAGQQYLNQMQDPASMQSFMNPYQQGVTDVAKNAAVREAQMAENANKLSSARQGTYGGARQLLASTERERNLLSNLSNIQAQGSNQAYTQGIQNQQFGANLGMQGYGQAGQAASTLGGLGSQQLGAQKDIIGMQSQLGQQQQAAEQQKISQSIQDWANTQQYPLMQLGVMSNMLRGLPMQSQTTNQYVAAPNPITQGIGLAGAGASIFNALKREGGVIKEKKMASGGIAGYSVGGSIRSKLYDMDANDIQAYIKESSSPAAREIAEEVLRDKTGKAGGGIIAFNEGAAVKEDPEMVRQAYIDAARMQAGNPPMLEASESYKPTKQYMPLTERIGRAVGIKDAGRQVPTKETTTMPMRPDGSDVPYVAGSAMPAVPVNPRSIAAAAPVAPSATLPPMPANVKTDELGRADAARQSAAPVRASAPAPTAAAPSNKIMPTAEVKGGNAPFGLEPPVDPDAGKTIEQLIAQKTAYMGPNAGAEQNRANLMAERANSKDEARRAQSLRMAEFFGAWGSTPGNTIVAGLNALKNKIPDFISDMKEESKIRKAIDKDIAELDKIDRLEKAGNFDDAAKRKDKLSKEAYDVWGKKIDYLSARESDKSRERAASISASARGAGGAGGEDKTLNALIGKRTDIEKAITAKTDKLGPIASMANMPDNKDKGIQSKILDARAKVKAATQDLINQRDQTDALIGTYKKVQNLDTGASASGDKPKIIKLD